MSEKEKCPIWECDQSRVCAVSSRENGAVTEVDCACSGGAYRFPSIARAKISALSVPAKIRLSAWIARENIGGFIPFADEGVVRRAETQATPSVPERLDLALEWLVRKSDHIGARPLAVIGGDKDDKKRRWLIRSFAAFSYSRKEGDWQGTLHSLREQGFWEFSGNDFLGGKVTAKGYARYEELRKSVDSSNAFVAMWFDDSMAPLREAIEAAVRAAGYEPKRVDTDPEVVGRIEDEIIALIRQSRFVVADFTASPRPIASAEDANPRGGVYYEAGFAHGLGRPVFFTCRRDYIDTPKALHFDTSHFLHIDWSEGDLGEGGKFREELRKRIEAVVGKGPKADGD